MDEVRKAERRSHLRLKGHRYTFLKANSRMTQRQREERNTLIELYPILGKAYRLKELFDDFWELNNAQDAEGFLAFWCDQLNDAGIQPFTKFANTVKAHWRGIVNYIESRMTNGILEGLNSKIQLIKARARGFRNTQNFITMIYFNCGKLNFDYPQYLT
jgi:transposase